MRALFASLVAGLCLAAQGAPAQSQPTGAPQTSYPLATTPYDGSERATGTQDGVTVQLKASDIAALAETAAVAINQRSPGVRDDASHGFAVGSIWQNNSTGQQWIAQDVTAGAAVWIPQFVAQPLIMDAVTAVSGGGGPQAAYGTALLTRTYAGKAVNVIRASDNSSQDIGFVNGVLDTQAMDQILANTTGAYDIWYDQSGSGNNATQSTAASRLPVAYNLINGIRPITCPAAGIGSDAFLTMPGGVATNRDAFTVIMVGRMGASPNAGNIPWSLGSPTEYFSALSAFGSLTTALGQWAFNTTAYVQSAVQIPSNNAFFAVTSSASAMTFYSNEASGPGYVQSAQAMTGGTICGSVRFGTTYMGRADIVALLIYSRALSSAEIMAAKQAAYQLASITPQADAQLIELGDSRTAGVASAAMIDRPRIEEMSLSRPVRMTNLGAPGITLATIASTLTPSTWHNSSYKVNLWGLCAGVNDVTAGETVGQMEGYVTTIVAAIHALGDKVYVCTDPPYGLYSTGQQAVWNAFNAWIRSSSDPADAVADVAASPTIGTIASTTNSTYWYSDQKHQVAAGYEVWANITIPVINKLLGPPT